MATLGSNAVTLVDLAKRLDPNGSVANMINVLTQTNAMLYGIPFVASNEDTSHVTTYVTSLPTVYTRRYNQGVPASKGTSEQLIEPTAMLEAFSKVDERLVQKAQNPAAYRFSEEGLFLESMNQKMQDQILYGNRAAAPDEITGLLTRFNTLSGAIGDSVINAGGSGSDNTSILIVRWSENTVHGIYPRNVESGLKQEDLGRDVAIDANGGEYMVLRSHFQWDYGLAVRDRRAICRIANIDVSDLRAANANAAKLVDLLIQGLERVDNAPAGNTVIYANQTVRTLLRMQINKISNVNLTLEDFSGRKVVAFDGVPIERVDRMLNTEAAVA